MTTKLEGRITSLVATNQPITASGLRKKIKPADREFVSLAVDRLVEAGALDLRQRNGVTYYVMRGAKVGLPGEAPTGSRVKIYDDYFGEIEIAPAQSDERPRLTQREGLLTKKEAARWLRVSPATVTAWCAQGKLNYIKIGRLVRIAPEELERYVRECQATPPESQRVHMVRGEIRRAGARLRSA